MKPQHRQAKADRKTLSRVRTPLERYVFSAEQVKEAKACTSSEHLLEEIDKMAEERWTFKILKNIPDYFCVYETKPSQRNADLQGRLLEKWESLQVKGNDQAAGILGAFSLIHHHGIMRVLVSSDDEQNAGASPSPEDAYKTFDILYRCIGPLLHNIIYNKGKEKSDCINKLKAAFNLACTRWSKRSNPALAHGRAKRLKTLDKNNCQPSPIAAIEHARLFCEQHLRLPRKFQVKESLQRSNPEMKEWKDGRWAKLWKEAGLDGLPNAQPWGGA